MTTEAIEQQRREIYEIAEAIAPTWERRHAYVEEVSAPVRNWMQRELSPRASDTVLELAAGVGETGLDAAAVVGEQGRLISTNFSPGDGRGRPPPRHRARPRQRRVPGDGRRADRARSRFGRRGSVPVQLHADGRPGRGTRRDTQGAAPGRRRDSGSLGALERTRSSRSSRSAWSSTATCHRPSPLSAWRAPRAPRRCSSAPGSSSVRTEVVPVRFEVPDVVEYLSAISDTGPLGLALRGLSETDREAVKAEVEDSLALRGRAATNSPASRSARSRTERARLMAELSKHEPQLRRAA